MRPAFAWNVYHLTFSLYFSLGPGPIVYSICEYFRMTENTSLLYQQQYRYKYNTRVNMCIIHGDIGCWLPSATTIPNTQTGKAVFVKNIFEAFCLFVVIRFHSFFFFFVLMNSMKFKYFPFVNFKFSSLFFFLSSFIEVWSTEHGHVYMHIIIAYVNHILSPQILYIWRSKSILFRSFVCIFLPNGIKRQV